MEGLCYGPGYASPSEAIRAPSEKLLYTIAIYTGTGIQKPDYLATIDVDPKSESYSNFSNSSVINRGCYKARYRYWLGKC